MDGVEAPGGAGGAQVGRQGRHHGGLVQKAAAVGATRREQPGHHHPSTAARPAEEAPPHVAVKSRARLGSQLHGLDVLIREAVHQADKTASQRRRRWRSAVGEAAAVLTVRDPRRSLDADRGRRQHGANLFEHAFTSRAEMRAVRQVDDLLPRQQSVWPRQPTVECVDERPNVAVHER